MPMLPASPLATRHFAVLVELLPTLRRTCLLLTVAAGLIAGALPGAAEPPITRAVVKRTLPNGLRVLILPRRTAPVVTTMLWYRVGSRDELPGATGLAHFLEHLLFKGTKKLKKGDIDRLTYQNGGTNNAFTSSDYTAYEFHFPRDRWKTALSIEADRMRNCSFDKKEFEAERQVVMEERRGGLDDPAAQFGEQVMAASYLALPYRNPVIGWMEDLRRVSRDEVYRFYQQHYVPGNATLVIVGDVVAADAMAAVRKAFAGVPKLPVPHRRPVLEPVRLGTRRLDVTLPTQVARLSLTLPAPTRRNRDAYALDLLTYVLSEGRLGRLYKRLVEGDRLAASASAAVDVRRDAGLFSVDADALDGVPLARIEAAVWEELERLGREPISAHELERARNQLYADWVHGLDTNSALATVLGEADALGGYQYLTTYLSRGLGVTAADITRAASRYFRRDRATIAYLHPEPGAEPKASPTPAPPATPARRARAGPLLVTPHVLFRKPPQRPPSAAKVPALFTPLHPFERVLPNGLRVVLLENHDLPSIVVSARVDAGAYHESPNRAGLANLLTALIDQGTATRSGEQISEALEHVGAYLDATARGPSTALTLRCLRRDAPGLLPLFAQLLQEPSFPADKLDQERARLLVALRAEDDDALAVAEKAFDAAIYGDHPGGRPVEGTLETVKSITREDLVAFHARWFRPQNTTLVAVGDFRAGDFMTELESAFSGWQRGGEISRPALDAVIAQRDQRVRRETIDRGQTQILLGHLGIRRTDPDYVPLLVLDSILGQSAGFTARIPYQLRDVLGLAYTVESSVTATAGIEPGVFRAYIGTEPKNEKAAIAGLLKEIRRIRNSPVTPKELNEARNFLANSYVFGFETQEQLAGYLQSVQRYGLGWDYRRRYAQEVRKVTAADLLRVARKHLHPDAYTLVVVGPSAPPAKPGVDAPKAVR